MWLNVGLSLESRGVVRILVSFKIDLCSAMSLKMSRPELSMDGAKSWYPEN